MYNRKAFKQEAKQLMRNATPHFMLVALVYYLLTAGLNYVVTFLTDVGGLLSGVLSMFLSILVSLFAMVMAVGFSNFALRLSRGEAAGTGSLFEPFSYTGRSIGMSLLVALFTFLWTMLVAVVVIILCVAIFMLLESVPALAVILFLIVYIAMLVAIVMITLRYAMANFALAENPEGGAMNAIRRSIQMLRGHKGKLFIMQLSFIGWELLVGLIIVVVLGIGLLVGGVAWLMDAVMAVGDDPMGAYNLTMQMMSRLSLWVVLAEVLAMPLSLWLITYQQTAFARFYNHVSGYDYRKYMEGEQPSIEQAPEAPAQAEEQPVQPPEGGYYTAPNPVEESAHEAETAEQETPAEAPAEESEPSTEEPEAPAEDEEI